jgi:uncharacterized Zn finger protein
MEENRRCPICDTELEVDIIEEINHIDITCYNCGYTDDMKLVNTKMNYEVKIK